MDIRDEISKRKKEQWFDVVANIEVLGVNHEIVGSSLENHVNKLAKTKNVLLYERHFSEIKKIEKPFKDVHEAFSQVVRVKFMVRDLTALMTVVLTYGPSSIEVMGPDKRALEINDIQNVANSLATLVHQFAAAGFGGIIISPDSKMKED